MAGFVIGALGVLDAYGGAALPLLLLFTHAGQSVGSLAGREVVATEAIRALVGSVGLVSAGPITIWLAVAAADRSFSHSGGDPGRVGHHRSGG